MSNSIIHIRETDSTNNYLKQLLLERKLEEGSMIYTDFQTAGKGQRGNSWESKPGENLLLSIVLYPNMVEISEQFIISQAVSLGVMDFLSVYTNDITIKWPNDIYWKDRKICGILIENILQDNTIIQSVCGIGININQKKFVSDAPNPVSLFQITGKTYDIELFPELLGNKIMQQYSRIKEGKISKIRAKYKAHLYRSKGFHLYNDGIGDFLARIKDILPSGILILETDKGEERQYAFKEVRYK